MLVSTPGGGTSSPGAEAGRTEEDDDDASARVLVIPNGKRRRRAEKRRGARLKRFVAMVEVVSRPGRGRRDAGSWLSVPIIVHGETLIRSISSDVQW